MSTVLTIGHSSQTVEEFVRLLVAQGVEVLVDVRSSPYSGYVPQFDRELLQASLSSTGVRYLFLGAELGGRPKQDSYYDEKGRAVYGRMTKDPAFLSGIERLERGIASYRVALMCGEEDPASCHRRLLVGRVLVERGHELKHIRGDGRLQPDAEVADESGRELVSSQPALFAEMDEDQWRSTASVSPKKTPLNSSAR